MCASSLWPGPWPSWPPLRASVVPSLGLRGPRQRVSLPRDTPTGVLREYPALSRSRQRPGSSGPWRGGALWLSRGEQEAPLAGSRRQLQQQMLVQEEANMVGLVKELEGELDASTPCNRSMLEEMRVFFKSIVLIVHCNDEEYVRNTTAFWSKVYAGRLFEHVVFLSSHPTLRWAWRRAPPGPGAGTGTTPTSGCPRSWRASRKRRASCGAAMTSSSTTGTCSGPTSRGSGCPTTPSAPTRASSPSTTTRSRAGLTTGPASPSAACRRRRPGSCWRAGSAGSTTRAWGRRTARWCSRSACATSSTCPGATWRPSPSTCCPSSARQGWPRSSPSPPCSTCWTTPETLTPCWTTWCTAGTPRRRRSSRRARCGSGGARRCAPGRWSGRAGAEGRAAAAEPAGLPACWTRVMSGRDKGAA